MGRPKGSKNKDQVLVVGSIGLGGGYVAPVTDATAKPKGENSIGKLNREIVLRFAPGTLTARNSVNNNLTCGGRAVDQNGIVWNITTAMPLNPATGKSCPTASVNMTEFLNGVSSE
jgi:hypothetical protein